MASSSVAACCKGVVDVWASQPWAGRKPSGKSSNGLRLEPGIPGSGGVGAKMSYEGRTGRISPLSASGSSFCATGVGSSLSSSSGCWRAFGAAWLAPVCGCLLLPRLPGVFLYRIAEPAPQYGSGADPYQYDGKPQPVPVLRAGHQAQAESGAECRRSQYQAGQRVGIPNRTGTDE